jgi:hemolysin activation/secretion protein
MSRRSVSRPTTNPLRTTKPLLAALLVALVPLAAQAVDPVVPGAGSLLRQLQPVTPPPPSPTGTSLTIVPEGGGTLPTSAAFLVNAIEISGNTLFDTPTLHALVASAEGQSNTLSQLNELAARITGYYHSHGYVLARAIIPAQTIASGIVRIEIMEARYGKIGLDNTSRVNDPLLLATLSRLQSGQAIGQTDLDHTLLLLSDIPGVVVNATLKQGETNGQSDLLVNTTPGPAVSGTAALDDYGNRYTGRARLGATVKLVDPLHHGDVLSVSGLSSGPGMNYADLAYDTLLNGAGTRLGASYSALHYSLGDPFSSLDAHGTANVESLWARQPLVRSRDVNLYALIQYDRMRLRDHIDLSAIKTDRHLDNGTTTLTGDARDAFLSGSASAWNVGWTSGHVGFDDRTAQSADASTARTQGRFSKWNVSVYRLQGLTSKSALYLAFSGQWASVNLDSSEKMSVGGPYSVRAYDMGAIAGDAGCLEIAEFRRDLGRAWDGQWQALTFLDGAQVKVNKAAWVAGTNRASLSGAGVGLSWDGPRQWAARTYIAERIGSTSELVASGASFHAWVEISKAW